MCSLFGDKWYFGSSFLSVEVNPNKKCPPNIKIHVASWKYIKSFNKIFNKCVLALILRFLLFQSLYLTCNILNSWTISGKALELIFIELKLIFQNCYKKTFISLIFSFLVSCSWKFLQFVIKAAYFFLLFYRYLLA